MSGSAPGPIKSLRRTFSSGGTSITTGAGGSASTGTAASILSKLPASAYNFDDFDFDDVDDDWEMHVDLSSKATNSTTAANSSKHAASSSVSIPSRSSVGVSSTSKFSTSTSSSAIPSKHSIVATGIFNKDSNSNSNSSSNSIRKTSSSPKGAIEKIDKHDYDDAKHSTMPLASQVVNIPSLPKMPKHIGGHSSTFPSSRKGWPPSKPSPSSKGSSASISSTSISASASASASTSASVSSSKTSISSSSATTKAHASLSSKTMAVPFSSKSKPSRGQGTLDCFARPDTKQREKRSMPWEDAADGVPPSKMARSASATPSDGGSSSNRTKGKGTGTGPLNVRQQIVLSQEQQKVLKMVVEGRQSVFFTGSAGTGKSILLREIISSLRNKYATRGADRVAVTASTGMAAANIGGTTIHSFAGVGLGQGTGEQLIEFVKKNRKAVGRWLRTEVLIIDEVSMVDGDFFDKLEHIARRFRRKPDKPFGGIQLIMTGDFFQLPPVTKYGSPKFAFEAKGWKECIQATVNLTKVFRQKDSEFIDMLNEMRFGRLTQASIVKFGKLKRLPNYTDGIEPTELFPLREQVESANKQRLAALSGEAMPFHADDSGDDPRDKVKKALENVMAPETLVLKIGAQVMLLKNMENGLVNGSVGKVVAFRSKHEEDEDMDAPMLPPEVLGLGANPRGRNRRSISREPSAAPLSRAGSREPSLAPSAKGEDDEDADNERRPVKKAAHPSWEEKAPVVEWKMPSGPPLRMRMQKVDFEVKDVGDKVKARRKQYPMICAWAMSIHKSQGQTLERVKCDLGRIFEKGQAYVALSRATSLDGLQVLNFDAKKVLAHPKVVEWTRTLTTLD